MAPVCNRSTSGLALLSLAVLASYHASPALASNMEGLHLNSDTAFISMGTSKAVNLSLGAAGPGALAVHADSLELSGSTLTVGGVDVLFELTQLRLLQQACGCSASDMLAFNVSSTSCDGHATVTVTYAAGSNPPSFRFVLLRSDAATPTATEMRTGVFATAPAKIGEWVSLSSGASFAYSRAELEFGVAYKVVALARKAVGGDFLYGSVQEHALNIPVSSAIACVDGNTYVIGSNNLRGRFVVNGSSIVDLEFNNAAAPDLNGYICTGGWVIQSSTVVNVFGVGSNDGTGGGAFTMHATCAVTNRCDGRPATVSFYPRTVDWTNSPTYSIVTESYGTTIATPPSSSYYLGASACA